MLRIEEIKNKKIWEEFLTKKITFYPLFQSWNWGEVQKKLGFKILRLGLFDPPVGGLVGLCLITEIKAKRGHFLHLRHGPVFSPFKEIYFDFLIDFIRKIAKERKVSFIRISPFIKKESISEGFFKQRGFVNAPIHNMDAQICWVLDIGKPEEELLKEMRKTHRYLIRKAQNLDIKIIRTNKVSDIDIFLDIYSNLAKRKQFVPHRGVKEELEVFGQNNEALLFLAEYENKIIAGSLVLFVDNMAIYHHGASLSGYRDVPASYLVQWETILEAKNRGKKLYNLWGVAPSDAKNHPWQGLTLFKTGFGGERQEFLHAQDLPLNIWYWKTYFIEYVTKIMKGY